MSYTPWCSVKSEYATTLTTSLSLSIISLSLCVALTEKFLFPCVDVSFSVCVGGKRGFNGGTGNFHWTGGHLPWPRFLESTLKIKKIGKSWPTPLLFRSFPHILYIVDNTSRLDCIVCAHRRRSAHWSPSTNIRCVSTPHGYNIVRRCATMPKLRLTDDFSLVFVDNFTSDDRLGISIYLVCRIRDWQTAAAASEGI